ncbi:recombination regulator RecX [Vibrio sp. WJH972]
MTRFYTNTLSCKESALRLLSRRDHGRQELAGKLKIKGYELNEIDETIDYCDGLGYLDDVSFAESVLRQHINRCHGLLRIRQELKQKKIDNDIIDQVLQECQHDWFELAKQAAEKKTANRLQLDQKEKAKLIRYLQYRGFSFDQIKYALSGD